MYDNIINISLQSNFVSYKNIILLIKKFFTLIDYNIYLLRSNSLNKLLEKISEIDKRNFIKVYTQDFIFDKKCALLFQTVVKLMLKK